MNSFSLALLRYISTRKQLSLHDICVIFDGNPEKLFPPLNDLFEQKAIEILPYYANEHGNKLTLNAPFHITYLGQTILEQESHSNRHSKLHEFRAWATLAISVLTLLMTFITLLLQVTK